MIRSMTGYGIAEQTYNAKKVSVEVKTLNSKQLDLQVKLPNELRFAELDFRNRIGAKLQRGKVDVVITITDTDLSQTYHIDPKISSDGSLQVRCTLHVLPYHAAYPASKAACLR